LFSYKLFFAIISCIILTNLLGAVDLSDFRTE